MAASGCCSSQTRLGSSLPSPADPKDEVEMRAHPVVLCAHLSALLGDGETSHFTEADWEPEGAGKPGRGRAARAGLEPEVT